MKTPVRLFFSGLFLLGTSVVVANEGGSTEGHHVSHKKEAHAHGAKCGHATVKHGAHSDYLHDGKYHALHEDHYDEHGEKHANSPKAKRHLASDNCVRAEAHSHKHGPKCGHKSVQHGDHQDYDHDGRYHATHKDHVDDHGTL